MLTPLDMYLFDTLGFVVIREVLSLEELSRVNAGIDHQRDTNFHERVGKLRNSHLGSSGRMDCGNCLSWPSEDGGDITRSLLCHPKLAPILSELCGEGYRLDHKPVLFIQSPGAEGFDLHGGAISSDGNFNFPVSYHCRNGDIVCNLINAAVQLSDTETGQGGFMVVPGSHKSNFPVPTDLQYIADNFGMQPACKAGDVVLFTEAVLHGAAVRKDSTSERRVALFRFAPATCAFARGYDEGSFEDFIDMLTPAQRAVVANPYHVYQDRSVPNPSNTTCIVPHPRTEEKREFDKIVFGKEYY
jgi:hypothetical protein